jgi:protein-S-isoprenylcysteine O-methyltransferase Ste14
MSVELSKIIYGIGFIAGAVARFVGVVRGRGGWANLRAALKRDRQAVKQRPAERVLLGVTAIGMQVIPLLYVVTSWPAFAARPQPAWAGWVGAVVFAAAIWLLYRSHADLGAGFSPTLETSEEQKLVTTGVFRHVRHPMYSAHILWGVAQVLLLPNWVAGFAFLVLSIPLYIERVPAEERMMLAEFGEEYGAYMDRTGRFFPRLTG